MYNFVKEVVETCSRRQLCVENRLFIVSRFVHNALKNISVKFTQQQ